MTVADHAPAMNPLARGARTTIALVGVSATTVVVLPLHVDAVDTDMAISTTAIDFGMVNVGSTASASVTLTNTGGDPFGPINMFGGAPPTAEFNASQNCQGQTLPAGGSCQVTYSFSPGSTGTFNDSSSFTVSETASQADGEDFSVSLTGVGFDPNATTTSTTTTSTTSTTTSTTTTTSPTETDSPSGASPSGTTATGPTAATTTSPTTGSTTTTTLGLLPLTGVVAPRPALVVKIDNVDAEPQSGLNQADVVFEEIVEGGQTRFAAVFNSTEPDGVGPIRSGRIQDIDLLLCLNDPAIAYSGANAEVNSALEAAGLELLGEGTPGFFRRDDLEAPHNLFANLSELFPQLASSGDAVPIFQYREPGEQAEGAPVSFAAMMVGSYDVRWDWDANQRLFLRSQLGSPHELTDGRASADSVVVLVLPAPGETVGSGAAVVYTDGQKFEGTWSRDEPTDPFDLQANGQPILLVPGRTWVELVDEQHNLTDG
jgi:hypothetical protein